MTRQHRRRPGVSLMEVMLALAILLLSLAAIGALVDIGSDRSVDARAYSRGTRLAQGKMAEVEAGVVSLDSETTGDFDGDDAAWKFTVSPGPAGPPNLYTVTVKVELTAKGRPIEAILTQMVFDPKKTGSAAQAERPAPPDPEADMGMMP